MTKETWLWLKGLEPLKPTNILDQYQVNWMKWGSKGDVKARKRTFTGIAAAMAEQWG